MINDIDEDFNGVIDFEEFLSMMTKKMLNRDPQEDLLDIFRFFDDDDSGKITLAKMKRVAQEVGQQFTDQDLQDMIAEADLDHDGEVNEEEFYRIMKRLHMA